MSTKQSTSTPDLGVFIRAKRLEKGISLRELARRIGMTAPFLSDIENGKRTPPDSDIDKIADALDTHPVELLARNRYVALRYFEQLLHQDRELHLVFVDLIQAVKDRTINLPALRMWLRSGTNPASARKPTKKPPGQAIHRILASK